jgi:hypothetical protein
MLDNQINAFINGKQKLEVADDLIRRREGLVDEMRELNFEKSELDDAVNREQERDVGTPEQAERLALLVQQRQEVMNRIEIVRAEINYYNARIRSIQIETSQDQSISPSDVSSFEAALDMVRNSDPVESQRMLELMLEDVVALRLSDRTRQVEIQKLEKELEEAQKSIKWLRSKALAQVSPASLGDKPSAQWTDTANYTEAATAAMRDLRNITDAFHEIDMALGKPTRRIEFNH